MAKHEFLIRMAAHKLVLKFPIEFRIDSQAFFILLRPDVAELCAGRLAIGLAFLGEPVDTEEFCGWVGLGPFGEVDVVFEIEGAEIGDIVAEGFDSGANFGGESCGGEDGKGARLEADLWERVSWRK